MADARGSFRVLLSHASPPFLLSHLFMTDYNCSLMSKLGEFGLERHRYINLHSDSWFPQNKTWCHVARASHVKLRIIRVGDNLLGEALDGDRFSSRAAKFSSILHGNLYIKKNA